MVGLRKSAIIPTEAFWDNFIATRFIRENKPIYHPSQNSSPNGSYKKMPQLLCYPRRVSSGTVTVDISVYYNEDVKMRLILDIL